MLTKKNVKSRLQALANNNNLPVAIRGWLNKVLDKQLHLGRDPVAIDSRVDTFLNTPAATMDARDLHRSVGWILERWENLPEDE